MFRRLTVPTVVLAACLVWARTASAQGDAAPPWTGKRPFAVEVGNGFNAPLGVLSFAVDFALFRYLSVAAGVGYGDGSAHFSTMARLRLPFGKTSVGAFVHNLGLGWSIGRHTATLDSAPCDNQGFDSGCPPIPYKIWDPAHRLDAEYSIELPLVASTLALRLYGGLSTIINPGNYACDYGFSAADQYQCRGNDASTGNVFPYFGVGLAMLFGDSDWHHKNLSFGE